VAQTNIRMPSEAVTRELRVPARPETLFALLTDPSEITRWLGQSATIDARPGGIFRVQITDTDIARGNYLEVVPHERVVVSWGWEQGGAPLAPGSTTVEFSLIPEGEGTLLRLRHLGLPPDLREAHGAGWDMMLDKFSVAATSANDTPEHR
jgi:uncharacterized protein YndB with AHSA1/START domain